MSAAPPLAELQRRLRALIAAPPPQDADEEGRFAAAVDALPICGDRRLAAADRVAIYRGMYFARLHDAIAEDYGALHRALGRDAFATLVRAYVAAHPPADASLRRAADHLPPFVAARSDLVGAHWHADLATLEGAMVAAFDASDEAVLTAAHVAALAAEEWPGLAIRPIRALVLLELPWLVEVAREQLLGIASAPDAVPGPPAAADPGLPVLRVWRQDLRVYFRRVSRLEADALRHAAVGVPFAALCDWLAPRVGDDDAAGAALRLLRRWLEDALLVDERPAPPPG